MAEGIELGALGVIVEVVREVRLMILDLSFNRLGVGIKENLRGVAPVTIVGIIRTVNTVAIPLPGPDTWNVAVPDVGVDFAHLNALLIQVVVNEA